MLYSAACINSLQKSDVDEILKEYDKARKILDFLLQSSIANYENFVRRLKKSKQRHVAEILVEDVGELIAQVNGYYFCKKSGSKLNYKYIYI